MIDWRALDNTSQPPPRQRMNGVTALLCAGIVLTSLFGHLGAIGLVGPDEPRYGWIARAMAETGDWVTPRLYGQPWFEKPVLYYWGGALGFLLHLPAEWALRLPSALAALLAAVAIGWLAAQYYGASATRLGDPAVLAPLLFSTTVGAIGFSRAATSDMLFTTSIALAMASAATILRRNGHLRSYAPQPDGAQPDDKISLLLFGCFLGLGVLAKGPAAVLLAGGALGLWALFTRNWRAALRLAHPYGILAFCVVAIPWYAICAHRNPDFIRIFIFQHNFDRYLTPVFRHRQPFWFFGPITLVAMLPWTALLWPAIIEGLRRWREKQWQDSPGFFFACWSIFPVLFFSFSQSKLPSYILPAIPALALLCSVASIRSTRRWAAGIAIGVTWIATGIAALVWAHRLPATMREALGWAIVAAAITSVAGGFGVIFLAARRKDSFIGASLFLVVALVEFAGLAALPRLDPYVSARWHAQLMQNNRHPDRIFLYRLPRVWNYGLAFYFRRELPEWSPVDPIPALVLTTPAGLNNIRQMKRFYGNLDEAYQGILYVPIGPLPRSSERSR
jgi:4-amino-4-deoxy-L-arabinose transferase-like glycosyltransferase